MPVREQKQKHVRQQHASRIAKVLGKRLRSESHQLRISSTNRLLPLGSLKKRSLKGLFGGWIRKYKGCVRLFTKVKSAAFCEKPLGIKATPEEEWKRMAALLSMARKRSLKKLERPVAAMPAENIDNMETVPMDEAPKPNICHKVSQNIVLPTFMCAGLVWRLAGTAVGLLNLSYSYRCQLLYTYSLMYQ